MRAAAQSHPGSRCHRAQTPAQRFSPAHTLARTCALCVRTQHTSRLDEVLKLKEEIDVLKRDEQVIITKYGEQHYARECAEAHTAKLQGAADELAALTQRLEAVSAAKHSFELKSCSALGAIAQREAAVGGPGATGLPLSKGMSSELARVLAVWPALSASSAAAASSTAAADGAHPGACGDESPTKHRASSQGLPAPATAAVRLVSKPPLARDARSVMSPHVSDGGSSSSSAGGARLAPPANAPVVSA
jgi:hypothetical protein